MASECGLCHVLGGVRHARMKDLRSLRNGCPDWYSVCDAVSKCCMTPRLARCSLRMEAARSVVMHMLAVGGACLLGQG